MTEFTQEQQHIINLINQLPEDERISTIQFISKMGNITNAKKNELIKNMQHSEEVVLTESQENEKDMIYLSIPDENGYFKLTNIELKGDFGCHYKINTKMNTVSYIPGEHDLMAIQNLDYYLIPACEIQNIRDRVKATKIQLTSPGKVYKSGDGRKIDPNNKIKIELI